MPVILFNFSWMSLNILLAVAAVLLAYIFLKSKNKTIKVISGILWLLFLPNTIYLFTDMLHILYQWEQVQGFEKVIIAIQFAVLQVVGFTTFILAFRPFEVVLKWLKYQEKKKVYAIILFNFLIAFGIVLGRVERINSWDVFSGSERVLQAVINIVTSYELIGLTILFGLFCNFIYFLLRDPVFRSTIKFKSTLAK
ncbi:MAG: DUF1361 domain-containing protein [Candidatus Levybacteria bacterium]|nr:DUF1361 domain-containing protein [Candidatus Levybacteria bacterium]